MGSAPFAARLPLARLVGVGAVVFLANAALLVLQLVASRLLAPFIGSDLYTWTSIIGVFLAGIALGNGFGGKLADRYPTPLTLAVLLAAGAAAAVWMVLFSKILNDTGWHLSIPLGPRIPLLSGILCLPAGLVLSLLTPVSIKLGLPDVASTGRVTGMMFSLSTLGCLLGNYLTGFYLIPAFFINTLVLLAAGALLLLSVGTYVVLKLDPSPGLNVVGNTPSTSPSPHFPDERGVESRLFTDIRQAYLIVFLASFCGMTLELAASRLIAQFVGVSLYTWTGVIGVMLAGTALGNFIGGLVADRVNRSGLAVNSRDYLAVTLMAGGGATVLIFVTIAAITWTEILDDVGLIGRVLGWTFALFFLPMFLLGMVSPQVIRLSVSDVARAGQVAGRIYAWSTTGAIVGTFVTGYVLVSTVGVHMTLLIASLVLTLTTLLVKNIWRDAQVGRTTANGPHSSTSVGASLLLYVFSIVLGGITGGVILTVRTAPKEGVVAVEETNYYTIKVTTDYYGNYPTGTLTLTLDHLIHSKVNPDDPTYIYYTHEYIQMEFLRAARARTKNPQVLVIGGGGYTFPRYAKELLPETGMDVVEIDPGVTRVAYERLGLKREYGIRDFNMDGRQFVAERAIPHSYDLVVQDAVNDLSVPSHLLTKEYNDAIKIALKPDGVYLLTIIDSIEYGKLWRAAMTTLRQTFPHVRLLSSTPATPPEGDMPDHWADARQVCVIYASDRPLDEIDLWERTYAARGFDAPRAAVLGASEAVISTPFYTHVVPDERLEPFLRKDPGVILTDQFAPVDNLMSEVFRRR
jgi:predicted membrane-bound spermidine synthase